MDSSDNFVSNNYKTNNNINKNESKASNNHDEENVINHRIIPASPLRTLYQKNKRALLPSPNRNGKSTGNCESSPPLQLLNGTDILDSCNNKHDILDAFPSSGQEDFIGDGIVDFINEDIEVGTSVCTYHNISLSTSSTTTDILSFDDMWDFVMELKKEIHEQESNEPFNPQDEVLSCESDDKLQLSLSSSSLDPCLPETEGCMLASFDNGIDLLSKYQYLSMPHHLPKMYQLLLLLSLT